MVGGASAGALPAVAGITDADRGFAAVAQVGIAVSERGRAEGAATAEDAGRNRVWVARAGIAARARAPVRHVRGDTGSIADLHRRATARPTVAAVRASIRGSARARGSAAAARPGASAAAGYGSRAGRAAAVGPAAAAGASPVAPVSSAGASHRDAGITAGVAHPTIRAGTALSRQIQRIDRTCCSESQRGKRGDLAGSQRAPSCHLGSLAEIRLRERCILCAWRRTMASACSCSITGP